MATVEGELVPRSYQRELMEIATKQNTIIFLPTGSGKTFIAVLVLKQLSAPLARSYSEDGQISIVLVNAVPLVEQHANVLKTRTHFDVGAYSGDMNVDNWAKEQWHAEFNRHQVLVMTVQILVNICNWGYLDLNRVNLLVFDECHHGVKDQPMRQVMRSFQTLRCPPRVLGLTATLLNANCKPCSVMSDVAALEVTYQSKVATVEELKDVIGFATNPQEFLKVFKKHRLGDVEQAAFDYLNQLLGVLESVVIETKTYTLQKTNLKPLDPEDGLHELRCMVKDFMFHLDMFGILGIYTAAICYSVQLERLIMHCEDIKLLNLFTCVQTCVSHIKHICQEHMGECTLEEKIERYTSDQVKVLIEVLREFKQRSNQELCSIIFVDRRFTAKILFHILKIISDLPEFSYIKPDFMVGYNNSPYNTTREGLYVAKLNKKVVQGFCNKETNLVVASNVLEEGVDIPNCTLVVKFNKPQTYRSYIQSKGRARHKESFYYILVQDAEFTKFCQSYQTFRNVEQILNKFLIGQNDSRPEPSQENIDEMYNELEYPPYIVNSARVDLLSAVALLSQYCQSFSCDKYTMYNPEWYIEKNSFNLQRVVILMPVPSPLREPIMGPFVSSVKLAKRAAALRACIELHKVGELDDNLKPKKMSMEEDTKFLFTHWPEQNEKNVGFSKTKRMHKKEIPAFCRKQILPFQKVYIHVIHLTPLFAVPSTDINLATLFDTFNSNLCYGLITANPLPEICSFPIFVSAGQIQVDFKVNQNTIELTQEQIHLIRRFHVFVFSDVIRILQAFLMVDNSCDTAMMLLVPVLRDSSEIDFDVVEKYEKMEPVEEPSRSVKAGLVVTADNYLGKIVTPWYRPQETHYLVSKICEHLNATSPFPSEDFSTFVDYYYDKYKAVIVQPTTPLLSVKGLSKRLNCIKPRGVGGKRKKELTYEEMDEHLIAEMCVKHEYPASLFIQAHLMPTVLYHVMQLLLAENLRRKIARETGMGKVDGVKWEPLKLDEHLLKYEYKKPIDPVAEYRTPIDSNVPALLSTPFDEISVLNHDVTVKMLEAEFPWKDIEEPKDINRDLNVTVMDIIMYENFVSVKVKGAERSNRYKPTNPNQQAITYVKEFKEKPIELLQPKNNPIGPQLSQIYTSMCTAKSNGLVNLERLETLGDSFLKLVSSLYILMRYPNFDEGKSTTLKSKLISNKNLFYLGRTKHFGGYILDSDLFPETQWLPPCFTVPQMIQEKIVDREISIKNLFHVFIPLNEQISGNLSEATVEDLEGIDDPVEEDEQNQLSSLSGYLKYQYIGDKTIADSVEALLGCYFHSNGFAGGVKLIEWLKIIPKSEKLATLLADPPANPIIQPGATSEKVDFHIPHWRIIEEKLGYHFKNRGFLLQALTHPSYSCNRVTHCYERLEFLGDAVLDFLITCFIYEQCGHLDPGEITDLRSALVNNNTFASYTVRCEFHKFFLNLNPRLASYVDKFSEFQESRGHVIDDTVLILLQENDFNLAEHIDVPKALGDLFEALAGAVYLDSGKDLNVVWRVFYKIMWKEIDLFSHNVPKNVVRLLHEKGVHARFSTPVEIGSGVTMIKLEFILDGAKKYVHGFGDNKTLAKRAAAKIALRLLDKKIM